MVASPLEPIPEVEAASLTLNPGKTSGYGRSSYKKYDEGNKASAMALIVTEMLSKGGAYAAAKKEAVSKFDERVSFIRRGTVISWYKKAKKKAEDQAAADEHDYDIWLEVREETGN